MSNTLKSIVLALALIGITACMFSGCSGLRPASAESRLRCIERLSALGYVDDKIEQHCSMVFTMEVDGE
jgi:hypothetical protein